MAVGLFSMSSGDYTIEKTEFSNVTHIVPEIGMEVELRDPDFIWSATTIVKVDEEHKMMKPCSNVSKLQPSCVVTLRYNGWGSEWDEALPWPNPRIARLFTYTKRVKCLFNVSTSTSTKRKRNNEETVIWPCSVHFRMPNPGNQHAAQMLREEINVFIKPYGNKLPKSVTSFLPRANEGGWINRNRLRQWKKMMHDNSPHSDIVEASDMADVSTDCTLPVRPFEAGTLLREIYRVHEIGGSMVNGQMYYAGFDAPSNNTLIGKSAESENKIDESDFDESSDEEYELPAFVAPPKLPLPMKIIETPLPSIKRLKKSGKWGSFITINGNDVFIGSFPTQTQALLVRNLAYEEYLRKASSQNKNDSVKASKNNIDLLQNIGKAREADVKAISLETCIATMEEKWTPENNFSLHDWTVQSMLYDDYLFEKEHGQVLFEKRKKMRKELKASKNISNKRKQSCPRKVNLEKMCYFP